MSSVQPRPQWILARTAFALSIVLVLVLYQQTVLYLARLWNQFETGEYGHGYLVLAVSAYLIYRNRCELARYEPCPSLRALPVLIASTLLWLIAVLVDVNVIQALGLLLVILATTWMMLGDKAIKVLVFPILFIGFAIPIWFPLAPILQDITADTVFWFIRLIGVPAARQENLIILPAGTMLVEEACSGLRYLLAALTLGSFYAYLNYKNFGARLAVIFMSVVTAILANIVRVFIIVLLGYSTDMQHPLVRDHLMLGWYLFGGLVILMLFVDTLINRYSHRKNERDEVNETLDGSDGAHMERCSASTRKYVLVLVSGFLVLSIGPAVAYSLENLPSRDIVRMDIVLSEHSSGWVKNQKGYDGDWAPVYHGATETIEVYYGVADKVTVYAGCYSSQKQGQELINVLNQIYNQKVWRPVYPRVQVTDQGDDRVLELLLEAKDGRRKLVRYWYRLGDRNVISAYKAKVFQLLSLASNNHEACVIAAAVDVEQGINVAQNRLSEFVLVTRPTVVLEFGEN